MPQHSSSTFDGTGVHKMARCRGRSGPCCGSNGCAEEGGEKKLHFSKNTFSILRRAPFLCICPHRQGVLRKICAGQHHALPTHSQAHEWQNLSTIRKCQASDWRVGSGEHPTEETLHLLFEVAQARHRFSISRRTRPTSGLCLKDFASFFEGCILQTVAGCGLTGAASGVSICPM